METMVTKMGLGQRHWLCMAIFVGTFFQYLQRSCFNEAVVGQGGLVEEFGWTDAEQGLALGAFFYGYAVAQLPAGWAVSRWGGRPMYFVLGLASVCSMSVPLWAPHGARVVFAARFLFGALQGPMWTGMLAMLAKWTPLCERATLMIASSMSAAAAYSVGFCLTALAVESAGWRSVFVAYGSAALLWLPMWHRYGWSDAEGHPRISAEELTLLAPAHAAGAGAMKSRPTPWLALLRSGQVWAVLVSDALGGFAGGIFFAFVPTYLHQQLGFDGGSVGWFSALPQLLEVLLRAPAGPLADALVRRGVGTTWVRKLFCMVSALTSSLCALCLGLGPPGVAASVVLITAAMAGMGPAMLGTPAAVIDMAPEFAGLIAGISNTAWALVMGLSSTCVGLILEWGSCPEGGEAMASRETAASCKHAWQASFGLAAVLFFGQAAVFGAFGSSERLQLHPPAAHASPGAEMEAEALCMAD